MSVSTTIPSILPVATLLRLKSLEDRITYKYSQDRIDQGLDQDGNETETPELQQFRAGENEQEYHSNMQWLLKLLVKLEEVAPPSDEQDDDEERMDSEHAEITATSIPKSMKIEPSETPQEAEYRLRHELLTKRVAACLTHFCGRAASGAMTRTWTYKTNPPQSLQIHDPSFIGGDVGFKTFGSAYLLSKHIAHGDIPQLEPWMCAPSSPPSLLPLPRILELGSGTGLVGLAATLFSNPHGPKVILSDYHPNVLTTLHHNSTLNHLETRCNIQLLDWRDILQKRSASQLKQPDVQSSIEHDNVAVASSADHVDSNQDIPETDRMDLILGAEVVYDHGHAELVAHVVDEYLKKDMISDDKISLSRRRPAFHIMFPIRKTHADVIADFDYWMDKMGFVDCRQAKEWGREDGETIFIYHWREYVRKEHLYGH
ncbi:hypothetical protein BGZ65_003178 [Modicella reniformis]|uniref:Uncharacterized protein n=1 Tax=Modicella reniformis TaxID=1440133 RepID=A0A9P6MIQ6_9FUNG|nr:hypothetical protein BGZ65_003178 [Modicella reniformis]